MTADANSKAAAQLPPYCRFKNGWFCKPCDRVTEHTLVKDRQVCNECGFALGKPLSVEALKEKQRKWYLRHRIAQLTKEIQKSKSNPRKQHRVKVLERRLVEAQEELSTIIRKEAFS